MKTLLILVSVTVVIVAVVILFISPITKYLVEKYDLKFTGRQITMDWAYVNPFTGYVHFDNFKIFEYRSDSVFLSAKGVSANFEMRKLFSKTYQISELILNRPRGIIIQIDKDLNFDDLIKKFSPEADSLKASRPVHFSILSIKIIDGEIYYRERVTPINYFITKVNIESSGIHWDSDTIAAKYSFLSGIGSGGMNGDFTINTKTLDYRLAVIAKKFDLEILEQYLKELTNFGYFSGNIDADLKVKGSFKTAENVTFKGMLAINEFKTGEKPGDNYASFQKLAIAVFELSPKNHKYLFDSVSLNNPYFKYEQYDYLDNLSRMFVSETGKAGVAQSQGAKFNLVLEIGNYIKRLSKNFFRSNYKINRLAIYSGDLEYCDYSMSEKFSVHLNPLYALADSITKNQKRVSVSIRSGIMPYGNAAVSISINPNDSSDFDLDYLLQKLPATLFNPYLIQYTSFPLDRGTVSVNGTWHVRNGIIKSDNHFIVIDPRLANRLKNKGTKWLPMRLIMAFIRERGNVIDYEVPISGDLKNPKFHLRDVIIDVLGNIVVKPVTTPYRMEVKSIETEIEKSLTLKWAMRSSSLTRLQEKFIEKMAGFLVANPNAIISVSPQQYETKEKEYILFYEAKKKYFLASNHKDEKSFTDEDSENVEKMSVKDIQFVKYLNLHTADSMLFTSQDKCARLLGGKFVDNKYKQLNKDRKAAFIGYFKDRNVENRIRITADHNTIPYNGYSFYQIIYKGEFPDDIKKAYLKMNELNDKAPRNLFQKDRRNYKVKT
ncbi:MAG: DUF748 domain-containing protein [Bacteroidales bacterium]|nr:DUF748 domain-containing protein [Bacteroidales bacterium]